MDGTDGDSRAALVVDSLEDEFTASETYHIPITLLTVLNSDKGPFGLVLLQWDQETFTRLGNFSYYSEANDGMEDFLKGWETHVITLV